MRCASCTLASWPATRCSWPLLSLSRLAGRSPLGISWQATSPIGGYALPADSLGLASATLGATLALSVLGAGFADCTILWWAHYFTVWPVGTDPHVCLLSNSAQCASSTCLALDTDGQRLLACLAPSAWYCPAWSGTADAAGYLCLGQPL